MTNVTPKSARERRIREFKQAAQDISAALNRKAYYKARSLHNALGFRFADLKDAWFECTEDQLTELRQIHNQLSARFPEGAGFREKRKSKRVLEREAYERFLYRNNTYQGPAS